MYSRGQLVHFSLIALLDTAEKVVIPITSHYSSIIRSSCWLDKMLIIFCVIAGKIIIINIIIIDEIPSTLHPIR
ncbi:unnamed protein product [Strongylus vulgaris]|uniref:Uncharacterized protein n=1 Tax=Strongylus vulgaris TaxID=40348 RepID=A0A3P7KXA9_STRVU|nr:unnamed protein product [Strongylus vulgaris]